MPKASADITITVLGSGTCVPSLTRGSCSVLVETGGRKWLIDSGAGTLRRLLEAGTTITELSCPLTKLMSCIDHCQWFKLTKGFLSATNLYPRLFVGFRPLQLFC